MIGEQQMQGFKNIKGIFISMTLIFFQIFSVQAGSSSSPLAKYQKRLDELNHTLKTDYALLPDKNVSYEEMTSFYQNMSIAEFEDYIYSLHDSDMEFKKNEMSITRQEIEIPNHSLKNTESDNRRIQKFYYSTDNYLYVDFKIKKDSNGKKLYDEVKKAGERHNSYPAYEVHGYSYTPCGNVEQAAITFTCTKYLSPYLTDTGNYHLSCIFKAGDGHVRASCYNMLTPIKIEYNHYIRFDKMKKFPDIADGKVNIYCFDTDTHWEVSFKNKWEDPRLFIGQDGYYAVYIIPDKDKGVIADVEKLIYITEFDEDSARYMTNKL